MATEKTLKLQGYEKDDDLVRSGALVSFGKNADGTQRVARILPLNSAAYDDRLAALRRRHPRAGERDPDVERSDQRQTMAEKVLVELLDGDCTMDDGTEVVSRWFTVDGETIEDKFENRRDLLFDRDFFLDVASAANARETFRRQVFEDDAKNSKRSSSGD
jgi:hypothetical protein